MKSKLFLAAAVASSALMGLGSTSALAVPAVVAPSSPPAPLYEPMPAPRAGYVWSAGHYAWQNGQYVWNPGHWIAARPGWEWQEARWIQRPNGDWYLAQGHWVRSDDYAYYDDERHDNRQRSRRFGAYGDLDGDGVLNMDDRDRDGDGVANRDDDWPDNPNRS